MSEDVTFCGVFDGHGPHGHLVARKVRDALPIKLLSFLLSNQSKQHGSGRTCFKGNMKKSDGTDSEKDGSAEDQLTSLWREAYMKSYKAMDKELKSHPNLDCFCSGSTAVTMVKQVWQGALNVLVSLILVTFLLSLMFIFVISRGPIFSWDISGILGQSWDLRTPMIPWWQFSCPLI